MKSQIHKIGIEIEGEWGRRVPAQIISAFGGETKGDGSIRRCEENRCEDLSIIEYTSEAEPIKNLNKFQKLFDALQNAREKNLFHYNKSMGFHIHISFKPREPAELISPEFLNFFEWSLREKYSQVLEYRKQSTYAKIKKNNQDEDALQNGDRYKFINLMPAMSKHGTIEFRIWPSNEPKKMWEYLQWTLTKTQYFLNNADKFLKRSFTIKRKKSKRELNLNDHINLMPDAEKRDLRMSYILEDNDRNLEGEIRSGTLLPHDVYELPNYDRYIYNDFLTEELTYTIEKEALKNKIMNAKIVLQMYAPRRFTAGANIKEKNIKYLKKILSDYGLTVADVFIREAKVRNYFKLLKTNEPSF